MAGSPPNRSAASSPHTSRSTPAGAGTTANQVLLVWWGKKQTLPSPVSLFFMIFVLWWSSCEDLDLVACNLDYEWFLFYVGSVWDMWKHLPIVTILQSCVHCYAIQMNDFVSTEVILCECFWNSLISKWNYSSQSEILYLWNMEDACCCSLQI